MAAADDFNTAAIPDSNDLFVVLRTTGSDADKFAAVKKLIDDGVSVDAKNSMGITLLNRAAESGYEDIVDYLLSKGADTTEKPDAEKFVNAATSGNLKII